MPWALLWGITLWMLRKWRNPSIFYNDFQFPQNPARIIQDFVTSVLTAEDTQAVLHRDKALTTVHISWEPPSYEWVKVNTDGSSKMSSNTQQKA